MKIAFCKWAVSQYYSLGWQTDLQFLELYKIAVCQ